MKWQTLRTSDKAVILTVVLIVVFTFSSCIHLYGRAGYSGKGPGDAAPKAKSVGFDTADYLPGTPPPGKIEMGE